MRVTVYKCVCVCVCVRVCVREREREKANGDDGNHVSNGEMTMCMRASP